MRKGNNKIILIILVKMMKILYHVVRCMESLFINFVRSAAT